MLEPISITINGQKLDTYFVYISYYQILDKIGKRGKPSVTFSKANQVPDSGMLLPGQEVRCQNGTVINCYHTDNA